MEKLVSYPRKSICLRRIRTQELATQQLTQLKSQGFPAFLVYEDGLYKVRVGAFLNLDHAVAMEKKLREYGYSTVMVREAERL